MSHSPVLQRQKGGVLYLTLNRPEKRNAMSLGVVSALQAALSHAAEDNAVRVIVIRGAGGNFCAGGDISDMAQARQAAMAGDANSFKTMNRQFGALLSQVNEQPQTVICVAEGAVLGGGVGLACVADITLSSAEAQFGLPETTLGVIPAQIAPFLVQRIGLTNTRYLALTGARFKGDDAARLGIAHKTVPQEQLDTLLADTLKQVLRCAPHANRATKALLHHTLKQPMAQVLDEAAAAFATAVQSPEGAEGTMAFMQKRLPKWVEETPDE